MDSQGELSTCFQQAFQQSKTLERRVIHSISTGFYTGFQTIKNFRLELKKMSKNNKLITYNKEHYTVMANDIIKGKQDMTLWEARIIRLLITQVVKQDKDLKTYTCRIQDLANFLNVTSVTLYQDIKLICQKLLSRVVMVGTGNPKQPWKMFHWIQIAEYDGNGNITLKLSEQIAPYVLELNSYFTQYQLQNILQFNSFYAIRLYELLKCESGICRDNRDDFEFSIEFLRTFFSCEDKYKTTAEFIRKVIDIGIREINDKSDLFVEYRNIKTGKNITSIEFHLQYNGIVHMQRKEEKYNRE